MTFNQHRIRVSEKTRTYRLEISWEGLTIVVPQYWSHESVERLLKLKQKWINKHLSLMSSEKASVKHALVPESMSITQIKKLFTHEVTTQAEIMNVSFNKILIKNQKTRWGSCSSRNNLNFNMRLCLAPKEVLRYVVIHELAHCVVHNHSKKFWNIVEKYCPEHKIHRSWLRKNARILSSTGEFTND